MRLRFLSVGDVVMNDKVRCIVLTGLFTACALAVNVAENYIATPLPGVKLGAANVFALTALVLLGTKEAFTVTLLRIFLAWLITGNAFALACSLSGALPAVALMSLLYNKFRAEFSLPGISVAGAWIFNAGQVAAVTFIVSDLRVSLYILPLFAVGTAAGGAVGVIAQIICRRIGGMNYEIINRQEDS